MDYFDSSTDSGSDSPAPTPTPQISSVIRIAKDRRMPIKHILLGAPIAVQHTTHRLHQLGYAEVNDWAKPLDLKETVNIVPEPGDVISMLVRYLRFE